ncbi:MAG: LPS export ABC transporter periplasmic protein LptC [Candidatus Omnitrophica bacterium]|nr:LPS export ABC transporter periplasmic protein LptC [Candidatus Omnitrophota bacterium]
MSFKVFIMPIVLVGLAMSFTLAQQENTAQETQQQISEFSLAGYGEKGEKIWDISGKTADIFGNVIKLQDIVGNMYGKENIRLTAKNGDFDKLQGKVHVEDNVVIATSSGAKLTTNSLDWDRKEEIIVTEDKVNITRENMTTQAQGAIGRPNLNQITLKKDVQVKINPQEEKDKIIITCDGPLEIDYAKNIAVFKNNVKVENEDNQIYSDAMEVYFIKDQAVETSKAKVEGETMFMGTRIEKIVARGNVKIVRGENLSYSDEAIYTVADKKVVLTGRPKLIIYSTKELGNASSAN